MKAIRDKALEQFIKNMDEVNKSKQAARDAVINISRTLSRLQKSENSENIGVAETTHITDVQNELDENKGEKSKISVVGIVTGIVADITAYICLLQLI